MDSLHFREPEAPARAKPALTGASTSWSHILAITLTGQRLTLRPRWRFGLAVSHTGDDSIPERAATDFLGPFHQAGEVVSHGLGADRAIHAFDDEVGSFGPAHVAEHH